MPRVFAAKARLMRLDRPGRGEEHFCTIVLKMWVLFRGHESWERPGDS